MIVLVKACALTIGLGNRNEVLKSLPIRVVEMHNSHEAVSSLKNESVNSIISHWDLPDAADGKFLKAIRYAKPNLPIVALVEPGNIRQEIAARSMGATAVLSNDVSDEVFCNVVACILGLGNAEEIKQICAIADESRER